MPLSERLLRAIEGRLIPWFDREKAEQAMVRSEELRQESVATRQEAKEVIAKVDATTKVRQAYLATGKRLAR